MMTTDSKLDKIYAAIPHRPPMLLLDEIIEQTDTSIVCKKTFRPDEYFFQGHYPDQPITPGVILCESTVQAGAILLAEKVAAGNGVPVLTRMNDVKFKNIVRPGDTIELHVRLDDVVSNAYFLTGQAKCNGKTAARLSFVCTIANPDAQ